MATIDYDAVGAEMALDWCPNAPASMRNVAAALVVSTLKTELQARSSVNVDLRAGGGGSTFRDPMRAGLMRRSGAAGVLQPWRRPTVRKVGDAE